MRRLRSWGPLTLSTSGRKWLGCLVFLVLLLPCPLPVASQGADNPQVCQEGQEEGTCANDQARDENDSTSKSTLSTCLSEFNQTSLAVTMSRQSSPIGSPSHDKLHHILSRHKRFHIDLGGTHQGLFDVVIDNIAVALQGYGLKRANSMDDRRSFHTQNNDDHDNDNEHKEEISLFNDVGMIRVEGLFSPHRKNRGDNAELLYIQQPRTAVLILQTEQICCTPYGQRVLPYMKVCHASPNCLLVEYAPRNWEWLVEQGLGDSVLLLPILHQHRLNPYYHGGSESSSSENDATMEVDDSETKEKSQPDSQQQSATTEGVSQQQPPLLLPLPERPIDVVFFGVMTPRRKQLHAQLTTIAQQQQWNIVMQEVENSGSRLDYMAHVYMNAKVCLIIHSFFADRNPGEYHRLSELAPSGCVPVVETFGDVLTTTTMTRAKGGDDDDDDEGATTVSNDVMDRYYRQCGGVIFASLDQLVPSIQAVLYSIRHDNIMDILGHSMPELASRVDGLASLHDRVAWWNHPVEWEKLMSLILHSDDDTD